MKKLLGIVILGLLLSGNAYAYKIKPGSGPLKLSDLDVEIFHTYLTEKLNETIFDDKNLPGYHVPKGIIAGTESGKLNYAGFFLILYDKPYIFTWGGNLTHNPGMAGFGPEESKMFAKKNKIVWKGAKKRISRKVSLNELKDILRELGFYN
tara:strand:+ start:26 stop:478 length:453 start_codon:yes stop_codon:yes gene_type:complete